MAALSLPTDAMAHPVAFTTSARSVRKDVGVGFVEWMASLAVRFVGVAKVRAGGASLSFFLTACLSSARSAEPRASFSYARVFWRELVAIVAVCARGKMSGGVLTAKDVGPHRYQIKMIGVYAERVAAKVIENFPFGNGAMRQLPCPPPCADRLTAATKPSVKPAVALLDSAGPDPATSRMGHMFWNRSKHVDSVENLFVCERWSCHGALISASEG